MLLPDLSAPDPVELRCESFGPFTISRYEGDVFLVFRGPRQVHEATSWDAAYRWCEDQMDDEIFSSEPEYREAAE